MTDTAFWRNKTLEEMTEEQWESLCDGCGKCCLHKLKEEDSDIIYYTNVACELLDCDSASCKDYPNRFKAEQECVKLTREKVSEFYWLPKTCAYRLVFEGKDLPVWHHLLTGSKEAMHLAGESTRGAILYKKDVKDLSDHIIDLDYGHK